MIIAIYVDLNIIRTIAKLQNAVNYLRKNLKQKFLEKQSCLDLQIKYLEDGIHVNQ